MGMPGHACEPEVIDDGNSVYGDNFYDPRPGEAIHVASYPTYDGVRDAHVPRKYANQPGPMMPAAPVQQQPPPGDGEQLHALYEQRPEMEDEYRMYECAAAAAVAEGKHHVHHHYNHQQGGRLNVNLKTRSPKRKRIISFDQRKAANIRERRRMLSLNDAFDLLRRALPTFSYEKKLSRIETLRLTLTYMAFMTEVLHGANPKDVRLLPARPPPAAMYRRPTPPEGAAFAGSKGVACMYHQ